MRIPKSVTSIYYAPLIPEYNAFYGDFRLKIETYYGAKAIEYAKNTKVPYVLVDAFKVCFDSNGGKGKMSSITVGKNKKYSLPKNKYTRAGYVFAGWNTKKNGTGKKYSNGAKIYNLVKPMGKITLYAQWKYVGRR